MRSDRASTDPAPIFLSELSLRRTLRGGRTALLDLPALAVANGFDGLELSDRLLQHRDQGEIRSFARRCSEAGCRFVLDVNADLTFADQAAGRREIDHVLSMVDLAIRLEGRLARISLGGQALSLQNLAVRRSRAGAPRGGTTGQNGPAKRVLLHPVVQNAARAVRRSLPAFSVGSGPRIERAVRSLEEILPAAERRGLFLAIENHWGITSRPEAILHIVESIGSEHLGTCPDFANFPRDVDPYAGLRALAPRATHAHASAAHLGDDGEERTIDYARCLRILKACDYRGGIAVEYVGRREIEGARRTRDLILKHW